jgi:hypothetical protein
VFADGGVGSAAHLDLLRETQYITTGSRLVTTTPLLAELYRYDQNWEHLSNGAGNVRVFNGGKGLELKDDPVGFWASPRMNSGPEKMRPNPGNNAGQDSPDVGKVAVGWKMNALKLDYCIHFLPPQLSMMLDYGSAGN